MEGREPARFFSCYWLHLTVRSLTLHMKLTSEYSSARALHYPAESAGLRCESTLQETWEVVGLAPPQRTAGSESGDLGSRVNHSKFGLVNLTGRQCPKLT